MLHIEGILGQLEHVYGCQVTDWSDTTRKRVNQRVSRCQASIFKVHRVDGVVYLYSNKVLPGTKPPDQWRALTPSKALEEIHQEAMTLAGVIKTRFSNGWRMPVPRSGDHIAIHFGSNQSVEQILDTAERNAEIRFGTPIDRSAPDIPVAEWIRLLQAAADNS